MIPGLKAGKFDAIIDGMSITEERKKEIDFSKPYAAPPVAFLAAKDSPVAKARGPADWWTRRGIRRLATPRSRQSRSQCRAASLAQRRARFVKNFLTA